VPHYGSPRPPAEAVRLAAAARDSQERWTEDALEHWRTRHGAPPTYHERATALSEYAKRYPARVPEAIKHYFRLPPTQTTEVQTPARVAFALGAVSADEQRYVEQWVVAARKWWAEQADGDDDEARAVEQFARRYPSLAPEIIGKLFHGLPQQISEAEKTAAREALK
jgi:hypothetical protein